MPPLYGPGLKFSSDHVELFLAVVVLGADIDEPRVDGLEGGAGERWGSVR
jgi:hypothetical protein